MSFPNHGSFEESELIKRLRQQASGQPVERKWPNGRMSADDDGELAMAIGTDEKRENVVIDFGKQVSCAVDC